MPPASQARSSISSSISRRCFRPITKWTGRLSPGCGHHDHRPRYRGAARSAARTRAPRLARGCGIGVGARDSEPLQPACPPACPPEPWRGEPSRSGALAEAEPSANVPAFELLSRVRGGRSCSSAWARGGRRTLAHSRLCWNVATCQRWSPTRRRASSPTITHALPASSPTRRSSGRSSTRAI